MKFGSRKRSGTGSKLQRQRTVRKMFDRLSKFAWQPPNVAQIDTNQIRVDHRKIYDKRRNVLHQFERKQRPFPFNRGVQSSGLAVR